MSLYSKRFTIKTMTLVGATRGYIRRPYLFQAALQGFIASLLAFGLLISVSYGLNNILDAIEIVFSWKLLVIIIAFQMSLGIFITLISTWFALNKYLRIKLDDLY
jgi:cell division transport system permease protein